MHSKSDNEEIKINGKADDDEQRAMHSKMDTKEIKINGKADEVIAKLFNRFYHFLIDINII